MKCQDLLSVKCKKNISKCCLLKFLLRVQSIKGGVNKSLYPTEQYVQYTRTDMEKKKEYIMV